MPDEPLGKNPFAHGTPAHQNWAEMNQRAKEQLALFHAEFVGKLAARGCILQGISRL
jgi:hypothetical protein